MIRTCIRENNRILLGTIILLDQRYPIRAQVRFLYGPFKFEKLKKIVYKVLIFKN